MHFSLYTVKEGANQKSSLPIGTIFCNGQWAVGGRLQGKGEEEELAWVTKFQIHFPYKLPGLRASDVGSANEN